MSKQFINEVSRMKDLFGYKKGQVISEQVTAKQKEAMNAGWGPVTDETAKSLPVGPDGKILPKQVSTPSDEFAAFPCLKMFKTEKKATGTNTQGPTKVGVQFKKGTGNLERYSFQSDGTLYSYGVEYGKWSCGTKPNTIIINGKEVSVENPVSVKPKPIIKIPKELKDIEGVKKFQDWMDNNHPNWVKGKNLNKGGGYGKFGPNTNASWKKYKDEYLKGSSNKGGLGVPTPDGGENIIPTDDSENPYLMYNDRG